MTREEQILSLASQVGIIASLVHRRIPQAVEKCDLVGAGWIGAIHAVDRWDPQRGVTLGTFAGARIRGAMLDHLRGLDLMSRDVRRAFRMELVRAELAGDAPPEQPRVVSIDSCAAWKALECGDARRAEDAADVATIVGRARLSPREHDMVKRYYLGDEGLGLVAKRFGVSSSRASQIRARVMEKLRQAA